MRVLALETSGRHGSIAILKGQSDGAAQVVDQLSLAAVPRTAESLLPAIGEILDQADWPPRSIQLVSVITGPGSFTGLRVGVTTAKTFAYAANSELVGIHTLTALAMPVPGFFSQPGFPGQPMISSQRSGSRRLGAILNAQRQELFAACYESAGSVGTAPATRVLSISAWLGLLQPGDQVVGPPLENLASRLPQGVETVPKRWWQPDAVSVGQLGIILALQANQVQPMELVPQYYRQSAAEEKADRL